MSGVEMRRKNPVSHVATTLIVLVVAVELLVIFGVIELRAETVQRVAPWASGAFGQLEAYVARQSYIGDLSGKPSDNLTITSFTDLMPKTQLDPSLTGSLPDIFSTNTIEPAVIEDIELVEPVAVESPTNAPAEDLDSEIPVG